MTTIRCESCGIRLTGTRTVCPLCSNRLLQKPLLEEFRCYPAIPPKVTHNLLNKLVTLCSLLSLAVLCFLNFFILPLHSLFVPLCLGIAGTYIVLIVGVQKWQNIAKSVLCEAAIGTALCILWDWLSGWHGWSVDFVIPLVCCGITIFNFVLCTAVRHSWLAYSGYFLLSLFWAFAILIFFFLGLISFRPLSILALTVAGVLTLIRLLLGARDRKSVV